MRHSFLSSFAGWGGELGFANRGLRIADWGMPVPLQHYSEELQHIAYKVLHKRRLANKYSRILMGEACLP